MNNMKNETKLILKSIIVSLMCSLGFSLGIIYSVYNWNLGEIFLSGWIILIIGNLLISFILFVFVYKWILIREYYKELEKFYETYIIEKEKV